MHTRLPSLFLVWVLFSSHPELWSTSLSLAILFSTRASFLPSNRSTARPVLSPTSTYTRACEQGLPPRSCSAYGDTYKLSSSSLDECVRCDDPLVAAVVLGLLLIAFFGSLGAYAWFTLRHPEATTQLIGTASILVSHLQVCSFVALCRPAFCPTLTRIWITMVSDLRAQTVAILGQLQITWPPTAERSFDFFVVNGLALEAARPECLLSGSGDRDFNFAYSFSLFKVPTPAP